MSLCSQKAQCLFTKSPAYEEGMLWVWYVAAVGLRGSIALTYVKTTQLPEADVESVSKKEFEAMLDVAMGGRAAEELSMCAPSVL